MNQIVQFVIVACVSGLLSGGRHVITQWILRTAVIARVNDEGSGAGDGPNRRDGKAEEGPVDVALDLGVGLVICAVVRRWATAAAFNEITIGNQSPE